MNEKEDILVGQALNGKRETLWSSHQKKNAIVTIKGDVAKKTPTRQIPMKVHLAQIALSLPKLYVSGSKHPVNHVQKLWATYMEGKTKEECQRNVEKYINDTYHNYNTAVLHYKAVQADESGIEGVEYFSTLVKENSLCYHCISPCTKQTPDVSNSACHTAYDDFITSLVNKQNEILPSEADQEEWQKEVIEPLYEEPSQPETEPCLLMTISEFNACSDKCKFCSDSCPTEEAAAKDCQDAYQNYLIYEDSKEILTDAVFVNEDLDDNKPNQSSCQ